MDYIERRQKDPQYLKTVIAQREIVIEECEHQKENLQKQLSDAKQKIQSLENKITQQQTNAYRQTTNLKKALKQYENMNQGLKDEKNQLEYMNKKLKDKIQQLEKQHTKQVYRLKNDFDSQKQMLNMKITKLEKNLSTLNTQYHIDQSIHEDKHKIIEDANRNLKGFANQHQQRMIIVQNHQLTTQIQFQSRQITSLLQKNQKLQEEIKQYKMDLDLHKNIQNDLVKRSSLAQNLIKQVNQRCRDLQGKLQASKEIINKLSNQNTSLTRVKKTEQSQVSSKSQFGNESLNQIKQLETSLTKLKFENAKLKNYNHFLENTQKGANKKYQTLGQIMSQYLEAILYLNPNNQYVNQKNNEEDLNIEVSNNSVAINLAALKEKDLKQWKTQQIQVILNLLLVQIKPYLSAESLMNFPEPRNIKVSFVEQQNKEPLSLPKIVEQYEKAHEKQANKKTNRFKDIPVDISTKILRSNLREWGQKINYSGGMPRSGKQKSKSIVGDINRSMI